MPVSQRKPHRSRSQHYSSIAEVFASPFDTFAVLDFAGLAAKGRVEDGATVSSLDG